MKSEDKVLEYAKVLKEYSEGLEMSIKFDSEDVVLKIVDRLKIKTAEFEKVCEQYER